MLIIMAIILVIKKIIIVRGSENLRFMHSTNVVILTISDEILYVNNTISSILKMAGLPPLLI